MVVVDWQKLTMKKILKIFAENSSDSPKVGSQYRIQNRIMYSQVEGKMAMVDQKLKSDRTAEDKNHQHLIRSHCCLCSTDNKSLNISEI